MQHATLGGMKDVRQLNKEFTPSHYNINLTLERIARSFSGTVTLTGMLHTVQDELPLHAKNLTITSAAVDDMPATASVSGDELSLRGTEQFAAGEHTVTLSFTGTITDKSLHGLYPCYYTKDGEKKEILATQFESHHAREVFPCVDEPAAKATFDLTLTTEKGVEVIANSPIVDQQEADDTLTTTFATTPKMSTYLLAFVVGEFDHLETTTASGVIVRTYATPGQGEFTRFGLETAVRTLEFYDKYFGLPYPLPKCDLLAIPDFSAGAMENWGCITFRENCFLVDEKNTEVGTKQFAAQVVIHELAHQWFGNLVTMEWWNDLWLNEGFARFMESFVADRLFPDWDMKTDFLAGNIAVAQRFDSLASTHPIQVEVHHPDEISTIFDAISYEKGAAALMMLHNYLGEADFQKGLSAYLAAHQLGNATTDDLWGALGRESGKDVASFMQQWIAQPGFPVITIDGSDDLTLTQQRFYANPHSRTNETTTWPVPLMQPELPALFDTQHLEIATPTTTPFKLNTGQVGFYFVAYTPEQRAAQKTAIASGDMSVADRLGLLNEVFELAEAGYVSTREALDFMEAYSEETNEHVWNVIASQLGGIRKIIEDNRAAEQALNAYIRHLVTPQLVKLGWDGKPDESLRIRNLRQIIIALACRAEEPSAVAEAKRRFAEATSAADLPADLRTSIYATAVRHGNVSVVQELLERYRQETFAEERLNLTVGVSVTEDPEATKLLLDFMQHEVKSQDTMYWYAYLIRNRTTRNATWQWTKDNWQWVIDTFGSDKTYDRFPLYAASAFVTPDGQAEYERFFNPMKDVPALTRAIAQGKERIDINVQWRERDHDVICDYLQTSASKLDTTN